MPSVIVIMLDGVSADHLARHRARTPHPANLRTTPGINLFGDWLRDALDPRADEGHE